MRIYDLHNSLIGKVCKLTKFGLELEKEYEKLFRVGNYMSSLNVYMYCHDSVEYEMWLIFVDESPIVKDGVVWYCLKEIGYESTGDYRWYTLNQVMICSAEGIKEEYIKL